jgi:hypothetical protein
MENRIFSKKDLREALGKNSQNIFFESGLRFLIGSKIVGSVQTLANPIQNV